MDYAFRHLLNHPDLRQRLAGAALDRLHGSCPYLLALFPLLDTCKFPATIRSVLPTLCNTHFVNFSAMATKLLKHAHSVTYEDESQGSVAACWLVGSGSSGVGAEADCQGTCVYGDGDATFDASYPPLSSPTCSAANPSTPTINPQVGFRQSQHAAAGSHALIS
jgi:hypothetical protein